MALVFANDGAESGMSSRQRSVLTAQRCTVAAIRSCVEWEPESFPLVEPLLGKLAVPLGLVPPPPDGAHRAAGMNREHAAARLGVVSVLAHGALGEFLTHCSRNSLMDGLLFGHPLVMLPIFGDQGPNTRQMEAKKVRLQVAREEEDGSFSRHGVASAVRAAGEARRGFVAGHVSEEKKTSN
ncbi:hypothetical protein ACQ4PT_003236 [Festuca glaucescens]